MSSNQKPTQAVILAGGLGTRLRPLTDSIPKPMIEFHGKPFLEYLIEMVRDQGVANILLLLGYLPDPIVEHFGNGSELGVEIEYSITPVEDETGQRIRSAKELIHDQFILMYCDNYWPMRWDEMWDRYGQSGLSSQMTVYTNDDGFTRNNLRVSSDLEIEVYDKSRSAPNLSGVDIGFMILQKSALQFLPEGNVSFEATALKRLVDDGKVGAYETAHRYYSIGSLERLEETERFLARKPAILLDRDGTLNKRMPPAEYVTSWDDWEWLPGSLEALADLRQAGFSVYLITNQPGIGKGVISESDLESIHDRMMREVVEAGGRIDGIYYCPHDWDEGCSCRKPEPGLLIQAQRENALDLTRTYFIGDDERDGIAAKAAGCPYVILASDQPLNTVVSDVIADFHTDITGNIE